MDRVNTYIAGVFAGINDTQEVIEQKQELAADINARIEDLVAEGQDEAAAFGIATSSMGDLSDLVEEYREIQRKAEADAEAKARAAAEVTEKTSVFGIKKKEPVSYCVEERGFKLHVVVFSCIVGLVAAILGVLLVWGATSELSRPTFGLLLAFPPVIILIGIAVAKWHISQNESVVILYDFGQQLWKRIPIAAATFMSLIFAITLVVGYPTDQGVVIAFGVAGYILGEPFAKKEILKHSWFQAERITTESLLDENSVSAHPAHPTSPLG